MYITVGIATVGRPQLLHDTLDQIKRQRRRPDSIIVCATTPADIGALETMMPDVSLIFARPGLSCQRNAIIGAAASADIIVFFDDDFLPAVDYIAEVEKHLAESPRSVIVTGTVLADGIKGPGLSVAAGLRILSRAITNGTGAVPVFSGYGCNMAVRLSAARQLNVRFDERLPLYAWQEDVDFSRRLAAHGDVVRLRTAGGVHLGVKTGRGSGRRLGYSQVANPLYLSAKRSGYPLARAVEHIARHVVMNTLRSLWPEANIDRRGRLNGNLLALKDLVTGKMTPEKILRM